jgi:hypothetical protein
LLRAGYLLPHRLHPRRIEQRLNLFPIRSPKQKFLLLPRYLGVRFVQLRQQILAYSIGKLHRHLPSGALQTITPLHTGNVAAPALRLPHIGGRNRLDRTALLA